MNAEKVIIARHYFSTQKDSLNEEFLIFDFLNDFYQENEKYFGSYCP